MHEPVVIVGAGLAGCEAAWQIANRGISEEGSGKFGNRKGGKPEPGGLGPRRKTTSSQEDTWNREGKKKIRKTKSRI